MLQFLPMLLKAAKPVLKAGAQVAQSLPSMPGDEIPPVPEDVLKVPPISKGPNFFKELGKQLLTQGSSMLLQNALGQNPTSGLKSIGRALDRPGMIPSPPVMMGGGMAGGIQAGGRPMVPTFDPLSPMLRRRREMY